MTTPLPQPHNAIWIARIRRGLSRKQIAALLGHTTTSQLSRWETGASRPSLEKALLVGYLLETPIEELFVDLRGELVRTIEARIASESEDVLTGIAGEADQPLPVPKLPPTH